VCIHPQHIATTDRIIALTGIPVATITVEAAFGVEKFVNAT
jgi:hypothetical protein